MVVAAGSSPARDRRPRRQMPRTREAGAAINEWPTVMVAERRRADEGSVTDAGPTSAVRQVPKPDGEQAAPRSSQGRSGRFAARYRRWRMKGEGTLDVLPDTSTAALHACRDRSATRSPRNGACAAIPPHGRASGLALVNGANDPPGRHLWHGRAPPGRAQAGVRRDRRGLRGSATVDGGPGSRRPRLHLRARRSSPPGTSPRPRRRGLRVRPEGR